MRPELLSLASSLATRGETFALATVVRREAPSSAQVGDSAIVTGAGEFHGWLGGSCTRPTVVREALAALGDGKPRLIALSPSPEADPRPGITAFAMTCHSGGSVDIYIEPVLPAPRLLVFGMSPAARALARIADVLGWSVIAFDPDADADAFPAADRIVTDAATAVLPPSAQPTFAVVATLGERDEAALVEALALEPAYLGLIASRTRFAHLRAFLEERGVPKERIDAIRTPAGLDIGAASPQEIALSIMAEIVQLARAGALASTPEPQPEPHPAMALDPVCGMTVDPRTARHHTTYQERDYWFCCGGCRERFIAAPERILAGAGGGHR